MLNVLMMVSWYLPKDGADHAGNFHYEQAVSLSKYCNIMIYYPYDRQVKQIEEGVEQGMRVLRSPYKLENKIRNRFYMFQAMGRIVKTFRPDIIHAQVATEVGRFAIILGKIFRIPVMVTEHSTIEASGVLHFPLHQYADFVYRNSRYNACVSEDLTKKLSAIFPKYRFHTVYNGIIVPKEPAVLIEQRSSEAEKNEVYQDEAAGPVSYRMAGCVNFALAASLYDREIKGIPMLLSVASRIKREGVRFTLHIVGDGAFRQEFEQTAAKLGVAENCIFHGKADKKKLYEILSQMDFLVSASKFESFGCTIAEAMMFGKPVVSTKSGGPESFVTKETGILVEKEDEEALYRGIREMMAHFREYQSDAIRAYAVKKFDMEKISRKYLDIYRSVSGKNDVLQ